LDQQLSQAREVQETCLLKNSRSAVTMQLWGKKASEAHSKPINAKFQQGEATLKRTCAKEKIIVLLDLISN